MRLSTKLLRCIATLSFVLLWVARLDARRPNVIVIFTDDQGWADAGCFGATDLETPHIDRLAEGGLRFTQFYAAASVCSPSRAGLLTGRYPILAGMPRNAGRKGMPTEQRTIAEVLRDSGYATAHIGKWHLGSTAETRPSGQGFDESFGHMGGCIDNYSHFFYWSGPNRHDLWKNDKEIHRPGEFFPDMMVNEAVDFIDRHPSQPFFIYFALNTPHYPYQGDAKWLEKYRLLPYPRDLYAAFVSTFDERIGKLLDHLDERKLADDTLVIFQSDHGYSTEERAHGGGGRAGPLRGSKFSLFEGGLRVPAIIRYPRKIAAGQSREQLTHGCDWFPTIADYCGVELDRSSIDGRSLVGVIDEAEMPSPHTVLHWTGGGNAWAIRRGPWKLIHQPFGKASKGDEPVEYWLSNLEKDLSETTNHADSDPGPLHDLKALHDEWQRTSRANP